MNRTLLTFIILTVLAFLSVLLPYGCAFSTHISENSQDWANFGSYVGGTLSPIIATLALFGLGLTIFQQKQQQQISSLETAIRNIESDFEACLFKTEINVSGHECNSYDILMSLAFPEWDKIIPKDIKPIGIVVCASLVVTTSTKLSFKSISETFIIIEITTAMISGFFIKS